VSDREPPPDSPTPNSPGPDRPASDQPSPELLAELGEWHRLDPRMLLVHPVNELIRFLPVLVGLFLAGTAYGRPDWWYVAGVALPVVWGLLRYATTFFRITAGRVELRHGILSRHLLSIPLDRVRTVDITARPVQRLLGLVAVRIGTGSFASDDEDKLDLDGLAASTAHWLRAELLDLGADAAGTEPVHAAHEALRLDPAWARYAPFTSTGIVLTAGLLGGALQLTTMLGGTVRLDRPRGGVPGWSLWLLVPAGLLAVLVTVSVLSIAGYLLANWGLRLTHTWSGSGGAWHIRRGLLTTRETTLDDERIRGVTLAEPVGLRLVGAARASAIVSGLGEDAGSALLVPPAPRDVAARAAGEVLGAPAALGVPLTGHGPRARRRRWTRALVPAAIGVGALALLTVSLELPRWILVAALLALPVAAALAADRARGLGHALLPRHLVAQSGSLARHRDALELSGVIGWNQRATWFQRRVGLATLVATTAGGRQAVTVLDVPEPTAVALAHRAHPELLDQFLDGAAPAGPHGPASHDA